MQTKIISYIVISMILFISCSRILSLGSKNIDTEGQKNIKSKYNRDNIIFKTNKIFTYNVTQKSLQEESNFILELLVIPGKIHRETVIKYKYYYKKDDMYYDSTKVYRSEITTVDENAKFLFIHPPRGYSLRNLELAPFPQFKFPPDKDYTWEARMYIGAGWGELSRSLVKYKFEIINPKFDLENPDGYSSTLIASSFLNNEKPKCTLNGSFHSQKGFTNLHYSFDDSTSITITLIE